MKKYILLITIGLVGSLIVAHLTTTQEGIRPIYSVHSTQEAWEEVQISYSNAWAYASFPVDEFEGYTSPFLPAGRVNPVTGRFIPHWGLDIAAPEGSKVLAIFKGEVEWVKNGNGGCGHDLMLRSGDWEFRFCHNSEILVKEGEQVQTGQPVALVGSTGNSTGPHVHLEVYYKQEVLDPALVLEAMKRARSSYEQ